jgi:hypothetical protein
VMHCKVFNRFIHWLVAQDLVLELSSETNCVKNVLIKFYNHIQSYHHRKYRTLSSNLTIVYCLDIS